MKKYLTVFITVTALTSVASFAEEKTDPKNCYKACMKKLDDAETCTYICYPPEDGKK
ncbi:MAG TPA: hypothetical protein VFS95_07305 [Telluria sp.]|jgi:hypothetical protein|nr:hypothetical protein [Telluria sp.]